MWRGIIKKKKPLRIPTGFALKNVYSIVNLSKQVFCCKISIFMDVWFEDDPGSTARKLSILSGPWENWKHTLWYHQALYQASDPTQLLENLTPWLIARHSLEVVWLYWYLQSNESCTSHLGRTQIHHEWQESAKIWVGIALPPLGKYFEVGVQCHCYPRCENISHIPSTFSQSLSYRQQHPPTHGHQYTCHLALCHSTS